MPLPEIIMLVAVGILSLPLLVVVHNGINNCCVRHSCKFCRRNGYQVQRWMCAPAFDESGVKTEFSVVTLDCLDGQGKRRLVKLQVWIFGVRTMLSNEPWPQDTAPSQSENTQK